MIQLFLDSLLAPEAPTSTLFILLLCISLTLLTSSVNRLLSNPKKLAAQRKEVKKWMDEFKEAQKSKDKKRLAKVEKQRSRIMKLQQKMSWQSMKISLLFFIPFILMWQLLWGIYTEPVAYLPGFGPLSIVYWYLLCSLFFSTVFSRALGVGIGSMN
ncbi:DUF106 domain-containing protein [Candidatus Bathyarchaeota archaeon]|nr:DUF106 domain-containing protein [Candidatus Bathyarchaeota archaeon]